MRILLATLVMTGFAASSAYAECGHSMTTAQSKAPVIVAQNLTPPVAAEVIDDTVTGSIVDEDLRKKRLILETQVQ